MWIFFCFLMIFGCLPKSSSYIDENEEPQSIIDAALQPIIDAAPQPIIDAVPPPPRLISWVTISGGSFMMGLTADRYIDNAEPVHQVTIAGFEMSRSEITVAQYRTCVAASACEIPSSDIQYVPYCNWNSEDRDEHPMNCVSWEKIRAFAVWVGGRLPSEAEWEYAARSEGLDRVYPWGDEEVSCERAVLNDAISGMPGSGCGENRTWPVCSKPAGNSAQGLCDMSGNVSEWVEDCYESSYNGAPTNGNARSRCSGSMRVRRGGNWSTFAPGLRATSRMWRNPNHAPGDVGFRVAR